MSQISAGRFKALAALAFGALSLSPDQKEELVGRLVPGKKSFHALTTEEADRVIDELKRMAGQTPTRPQPRGRRQARAGVARGDVTLMVTPAQRERLAELTRSLIEAGLTPMYVEGARERACGRPYPRTAHEAERAIEGLKALAERVAEGWRPAERIS